MDTPEMVELYYRSPLTSGVTTIYGRVGWMDYLRKEQQRITRNPQRRAEVSVNAEGATLLVDNQVGAAWWR